MAREKPDNPDDNPDDNSDADRAAFMAFGRAMLSAQLLEFTIFQLAHLDRKSPTDLERALKKIDGLLKQPKRDQGKNLKGLGADLLDDIETALQVRNRIAHDALVEYRLELATTGDAAGVMAVLEVAHLYFEDVRERLDAIADGRLEKQGIHRPYLEDDEMDDLMKSLGNWAQDLGTPPDDD